MIIFEFEVLLCDCNVYRQNVTYLKRVTKYGHYAGDSQLSLKSLRQKLERLVVV